MNCINSVFLRGRVIETPSVTHQAYGEEFYSISLEIIRLSGTPDIVSVIISERLFPSRYITDGDELEITGEFRSKNMDIEGRRRLILYVFARDVQFCLDKQEHENRVELCGFLCKQPMHRKTPLGREISDLMLAVNRRYGRSDYIPCLAWGRDAVFAQTLRQSDALHLWGRIQSRRYMKNTPEGQKEMTAWEVSCSKMELCDE